MNYKTPVLKGDYKKGVIIPEKNIEKLIEKFGWVKIVFPEVVGKKKPIKIKKETLKDLYGIWEGAEVDAEGELKVIRNAWKKDIDNV